MKKYFFKNLQNDCSPNKFCITLSFYLKVFKIFILVGLGLYSSTTVCPENYKNSNAEKLFRDQSRILVVNFEERIRFF